MALRQGVSPACPGAVLRRIVASTARDVLHNPRESVIVRIGMGHKASLQPIAGLLARKATQWTARGRAIIDRRSYAGHPFRLQRAAHSQAPCRYRPRDGDTPLQLRPYFRRWADWMLTTDKRQRIRLAMSGLAALLMVFCLVVMNSVAAAGLASTVRGARGRRARFWG